MLQLAESVTHDRRRGHRDQLGFLVAWAISKLSRCRRRSELWSVALGIGITAVVGIVFGVSGDAGSPARSD